MKVLHIGLHTDLEKFLSQCRPCQTFQKNQTKEPLSVSHPIPDLPWQYAALDQMDYAGNGYLVTADHYSHLFEVDRLRDKTAGKVIWKLTLHVMAFQNE